MKLIRVFGIFVLISLVVGVGSAFNGNNSTTVVDEVEQSSGIDDNISFSASEEDLKDEAPEMVDKKQLDSDTDSNISTNIVDKKIETVEKTNSNESSSVKDNQEQNNVPENVEKEQKKESIDQKEQTTITNENIKQEEVKQDSSVSDTDMKVEEKVEEEIDYELERLMAEVEYATYDKCMENGFSIALTDTVNILGFSCPYIVYKNQILGYRLKLDYTNPMEN